MNQREKSIAIFLFCAKRAGEGCGLAIAGFRWHQVFVLEKGEGLKASPDVLCFRFFSAIHVMLYILVCTNGAGVGVLLSGAGRLLWRWVFQW